MRHLRESWKRLAGSSASKLSGFSSYPKSAAGLPVLGILGYGFNDRPAQAEEAGALTRELRDCQTLSRAWTFGGVTAGWHKLGGASKSDCECIQAYASFDALSPWIVGACVDNESARSYFSDSGMSLGTSRG